MNVETIDINDVDNISFFIVNEKNKKSISINFEKDEEKTSAMIEMYDIAKFIEEQSEYEDLLNLTLEYYKNFLRIEQNLLLLIVLGEDSFEHGRLYANVEQNFIKIKLKNEFYIFDKKEIKYIAYKQSNSFGSPTILEIGILTNFKNIPYLCELEHSRDDIYQFTQWISEK